MGKTPSAVDVIVIGGGPAGAVAASALALDGRSVVVLEREHFPRYHIGESLLPATIHGVCDIIGAADEIHRAGFVRKLGGCFRWGANPDIWTFRFSDQLAAKDATDAYQVERSKFDDILLKNAARCGADVREGVTVREAIRENGRFVGVRYTDGTTEHELRAKFVVDASGQTGLLANEVGKREYDRFFRNMALFGYFAGGKRLDPPHSGNILTAAFSEGWIWYIPLRRDLTSVGVVLPKENAAGVLRATDRRRVLHEMIAKCPIVADMVGNAPMVEEGQYGEIRLLRDFSFSNPRFYADGGVLIGDAACFIDPVFSSGVHLATLSGLLAARSINSCLAGELSEDESFREFERRYRREYAVFYQFLVAFYEIHNEPESYFWAARKIVSAQSDMDAFVRLVAGLSDVVDDRFTSPTHFVESTLDESRVLQQAASFDSRWSERDPALAARAATHIAVLNRERSDLLDHGARRPTFAEGLVPDASRLRWQRYVAPAELDTTQKEMR